MLNSKIIHQVQTEHKMVAFTFDDGPDPLYTPQLLDIFRGVGKATFFMVGKQIKEHLDVAHAVFEEGHEIGNHTYYHPFLTKISAEERSNELERAEQAIIQVIGRKPRTFRPPYFDFNDEVASISEAMEYPAIGAMNMQAQDWAQPGVAHILEHTRGHIQNGSILLFHDGFGDRSQTVEAVRVLVPEAIRQGYRLVTVSELLELAP